MTWRLLRPIVRFCIVLVLFLGTIVPGAPSVTEAAGERGRSVERGKERGKEESRTSRTRESPTSGPIEQRRRDSAGELQGRGKGCIYCVLGENTQSGKDYIGRTNDLSQRRKNARDGRDRSNAEIVGTYPKGDHDAARTAEQRAMNERGGVKSLDNKRNEIAPESWSSHNVKPPE